MVEVGASNSAESPRRRVILLGASNLARSIATIVDTADRVWGGPLDVMAALGHGRSYGTRSTVLGRTLPSIQHSELWTALDKRPAAPTAALVTDIGNDLMYEAPVAKIVDWVSHCLDALQTHQARIVMTRLPVRNVELVPPWKFRLLRRLMFPLGTMPYSTLKERVDDLDRRLADIAAARGITLVEQDPAWYGWDPIHLKSPLWPSAWHHIVSGWSDAATEPVPRNPGLGRLLYLRTRVPHRRWWFGIPQNGSQPAARFPDGTTISLY